ncbi:ciliary microtubule inner protein 5-like isoform X2 [Glandiceps talaboti]
MSFSYYEKSAYHQTCVPAEKKAASQPSEPSKNYSQQDYGKCDTVTQDKIWKQMVGNERKCITKWEESWGFLKDYDPKGNLKEPEELPDKVSVFSEDVPNTASQVLGNRLKTDTAKQMLSLEHRFMTQHRHKASPDLLCYD